MSRLDKVQLRTALIHDLGVTFDERQEAATNEVYRIEGEVRAFKRGAEAVNSLLGHVDKDVEAGSYDLAVATWIKRYLVRVHGALDNLAAQGQLKRERQLGQADAHRDTVALVKKLHEESLVQEARIQAELRLLEAQGGDAGDLGRPTAARMSIKEQRLAEEAAALSGEASEAPLEVSADEAEASAESASPPKKGRKKKA